MSLISHKRTKMGFALQTGLGVPAAAPDILLPLDAGEDLAWNRGLEFFQYAGLNDEVTHYYTSGEWLEGSLTIPWVPLLMSTTYDLKAWAFDRDADGQSSQYATIFKGFGEVLEKRWADGKCTGGSVAVDYGDLARITFNCLGIERPEDLPGAWGSPTLLTTRPYVFKDVRIRLGIPGALAVDIRTRNHTIEWDNMVEGASDAGTLVYGATTPYDLGNDGNPQWSGTFDRRFVSKDIWDAWMAQTVAEQECAYELRLASDVANATLTFDRIVFTEAEVKVPERGILVQDGIAFQALGGVTGVPASDVAYTFEETT